MVISLALLGFGASGTLVALLREPLLRRFEWVFPTSAMAFAVSAPVVFQLAQQIPVRIQKKSLITTYTCAPIPKPEQGR